MNDILMSRKYSGKLSPFYCDTHKRKYFLQLQFYKTACGSQVVDTVEILESLSQRHTGFITKNIFFARSTFLGIQ